MPEHFTKGDLVTWSLDEDCLESLRDEIQMLIEEYGNGPFKAVEVREARGVGPFTPPHPQRVAFFLKGELNFVSGACLRRVA